jgi:hypothetical protein
MVDRHARFDLGLPATAVEQSAFQCVQCVGNFVFKAIQ